MLCKLQQYGPVFLYLVLLSYVCFIFNAPIVKVVESVAHASVVMNTGLMATESSDIAHHQQEVALEKLSNFKKLDQKKSKQDEPFHPKKTKKKYQVLNAPESLTSLHLACTTHTFNYIFDLESIVEPIFPPPPDFC